MYKKIDSRWIRIILVFPLLLTCCQRIATENTKQTLTVVAPWGIKGNDPLVSGYVLVRMGCLETLTGSDGKGGVKPCLAESWGISPDKLTWRFTLRKGVRFHDGTMMTAEGVVRSLLRVFQRHKLFATPYANIESIKPVGERDIVITTTAPFAPLPSYLAHYSTAVISPASITPDGEVSSVIGTGFYRLVSSKMDTLLEFEAFTDYWGEKPAAARTRYLTVVNPETRAMMAESGEADLVLTLSPASADLLRRSERVEILSTVMPRVRIIKVNTNLSFFDTEEERRAFSLSIDRERIARTLLGNPEMAASQLLPPTAEAWNDPRLKPLRFAPNEALNLLRNNGWEKGPDGILQKDGKRFVVELITYSSRPMLPIIAQALQAQLEEVGIRLKVSVVEGSTIYQRHGDGSLESALYSQNFGLVPDAIGTLAYDFGPKSGRWGWGAMGWESEEMNRLIREYFMAFNEKEAAAIRRKIIDRVQRELPLIPVTWYEHYGAVNKRIRGVQLDSYELRPYLEGVKWAE